MPVSQRKTDLPLKEIKCRKCLEPLKYPFTAVVTWVDSYGKIMNSTHQLCKVCYHNLQDWLYIGREK